jgi:hypothetical protein
LVKWEDGSEYYEPLDQIIRDDPVTLAKYAKQHHLLSKPKRLKHVATKLINSASGINHMSLNISADIHRKGPVFQFGIQVPRNVNDAYDIDAKNGNTK